jgi:hypothetical protein
VSDTVTRGRVRSVFTNNGMKVSGDQFPALLRSNGTVTEPRDWKGRFISTGGQRRVSA